LQQNIHKASIFLLLNILLFLSRNLFSSVNQDGDFQYWQFFSLRKQISECRNFFIQTELRIGDDVSKPYLHYVQGIDLHRFKPWLSLGLGYRQLAIRIEDTWKPAYSPLFDLIFHGEANSFIWTNRVRTQYQWGPNTSRWIARNRIWLSYPSKYVSLVVSDEVFFTRQIGFVQNRFYIGPLFHLPKEIDLQLFYQLRHAKFNSWNMHHIFGCYIFFTF